METLIKQRLQCLSVHSVLVCRGKPLNVKRFSWVGSVCRYEYSASGLIRIKQILFASLIMFEIMIDEMSDAFPASFPVKAGSHMKRRICYS